MRNPFNPLRGWHVLILILMFFGVTIGVNATFVTLALSSHPGEDVPRSYVQGLNYNDTLDRRNAQAALGWSARVNQVDGDLVLAIDDADGAAVAGLELAGQLIHPADTGADCDLAFTEARPGVYRSTLPCGEAGDWRLRVHTVDGPPFEMMHALRLP
ncbi:FixH family protein [Maricaulis sp.]|jgi:nitrogen fixation protein FixH|uniref:FixH family protein n=1 Tax=Maricaulis sp. TaxID=1486257 RepID=UPI000C52947F|nr:FixH family protein [Maricaulis sp.]MAC89398.1 nitrogen fixation protein FixH [Maricaulis sp.]